MTRKAYLYFAPEQAGRMAGSICAFLDAAGDTGVARPTWQDCLPMVERVLSNELDARSKWAHAKSSEDLFAELMPWTANVPHGPEYEEFYTEVIVRVVKDVNRWIETFLPSAFGYSGKAGVTKTWVVWYVKRMGRDIMVEEGPDFRILDWHERMSSGEWKDENGIFNAEVEALAETVEEHRDDIEVNGDSVDTRDTRTGHNLNRRAGPILHNEAQRQSDRQFYRSTAPVPMAVDKIIELGNGDFNKE